MDKNNFKKISDKVKKPEFSVDFKSLNMILRGLSIFGNFASIFLASFFITELLGVAITNVVVMWVVAIIALAGLELTKREIFFRFSRDFIRTKQLFTASVAPMLVSTLLLISLSFYSSLSGAKEFSSKSDNIEQASDSTISLIESETQQAIAYYTDSLNNIEFRPKLDILEKQNSELFEANKRIDVQVERLLEENPTWSNTAKKLREPQKDNNILIEKNDAKIKELKEELSNKISSYKKELETESAKKIADIRADSNKNIEDNQSDSLIFVATSTLIEFLILIGIYFNNIYNFRSFRDYKKRLSNDDNFRLYVEYSSILDLIYMNREDSVEKELIPERELLVELLAMNKDFLTDSQVGKSIKIFEALGILETNGEYTYTKTTKDDAEQILKKHFKV